jgi:hypothetical protein
MMLNFDQQIQFASALTGQLVEATSGILSASSAMLGNKPPQEAGRSWYRPVASNPFDWTTWQMPASTQPQWSPWTTSFGSPSFSPIPFSQQPWAALASFASNMAALQSYQSAWTPRTSSAVQSDLISQTWEALMWPLAQFTALAAATAEPNPYSSYRSDSGHASAQIAPAPAQPAIAAILVTPSADLSTVH